MFRELTCHIGYRLTFHGAAKRERKDGCANNCRMNSANA